MGTGTPSHTHQHIWRHTAATHRMTPLPASVRRVTRQVTMVRPFENALPARHAVVTRANAHFPRRSSAGVRRGRLYHRCPRYVGLHWTLDRHLDALRARSHKACFGTRPQCARCRRALALASVGYGSYGGIVGQGCRCRCVEGKDDGICGICGGWRAWCVLPLMTYAMTWNRKVLRWRTRVEGG